MQQCQTIQVTTVDELTVNLQLRTKVAPDDVPQDSDFYSTSKRIAESVEHDRKVFLNLPGTNCLCQTDGRFDDYLEDVDDESVGKCLQLLAEFGATVDEDYDNERYNDYFSEAKPVDDPKNESHRERVAFRRKLMDESSVSLFYRIPRLGLPKEKVEFLLYGEKLDVENEDDEGEDDEDDGQDDEDDDDDYGQDDEDYDDLGHDDEDDDDEDDDDDNDGRDDDDQGEQPKSKTKGSKKDAKTKEAERETKEPETKTKKETKKTTATKKKETKKTAKEPKRKTAEAPPRGPKPKRGKTAAK